MRRFLVTGGAGFIGSNLVRALLARGDGVRVLDDLSTGRERNLDGVMGDVDLVQASVADAGALLDATEGCDGVFHQAAIPAVPRSVEDPSGTHLVNATGTLNALQVCRQRGGLRLVYAASSSAYGNLEAEVKHEGLRPDPCSPYAVQKLCGEHYCKAFAEILGVPALSLRYFNVFGPRQDPASDYAAVIPAFIRRMQAGRRPIVYGDGLQSRDFTYIDDVIKANLRAMDAPDEALGGVYNVARGERATLLDLIDRLNAVFGTSLAPEHQPPRPGDVRHSLADVTLARERLGWTAEISLEEGLRRTAAWIAEEE